MTFQQHNLKLNSMLMLLLLLAVTKFNVGLSWGRASIPKRSSSNFLHNQPQFISSLNSNSQGKTTSLHSSVTSTEEKPFSPLKSVLRFRGPVSTGYGRGSKKLGIPTANLPESLFGEALSQMETGVYFGWAVVEDDKGRNGMNVPQKAVVNIGYSPTFQGEENAEKIVEAHLIMKQQAEDASDEDIGINKNIIQDDFYGNMMRLQLVGFLRKEQKFDDFSDLITAINNDVKNASEALDLQDEPYSKFQSDQFLVGACTKPRVPWVGCGGGNEDASWESEGFFACVYTLL